MDMRFSPHIHIYNHIENNSCLNILKGKALLMIIDKSNKNRRKLI